VYICYCCGRKSRPGQKRRLYVTYRTVAGPFKHDREGVPVQTTRQEIEREYPVCHGGEDTCFERLAKGATLRGLMEEHWTPPALVSAVPVSPPPPVPKPQLKFGPSFVRPAPSRS
jgi:hypothetical protein